MILLPASFIAQKRLNKGRSYRSYRFVSIIFFTLITARAVNNGRVVFSLRLDTCPATPTRNSKECGGILPIVDPGHNGDVVLSGLLRDGADITPAAIQFVVRMNCLRRVQTLVLVGRNPSGFIAAYNHIKADAYQDGVSCAPLMVEIQPSYISSVDNRIERIRHLRNFQRHQISKLLADGTRHGFSDLDRTSIILADLDLVELPSTQNVMEHTTKVVGSGSLDILCSAGVTKTVEGEIGYYDIFATVLLNDTFVYPVEGRQIQRIWPNEESAFILRQNYTNVDLLKWFISEGHSNNGKASNRIGNHSILRPVHVRSCFGGLAIYKASRLLDLRCSY